MFLVIEQYGLHWLRMTQICLNNTDLFNSMRKLTFYWTTRNIHKLCEYDAQMFKHIKEKTTNFL